MRHRTVDSRETVPRPGAGPNRRTPPRGNAPSGLAPAADSALREFLFHLSLVRAVSGRTVEAYAGDIRALFRHLGQQGIQGPAGVEAQHLRAYLIHLRELGRQPATVARMRSAIRTFYAFLIDEGLVTEDPSTEIEAPSLWHRVPRALTVQQAVALVESVVGADPLALRDRALLETAYGTGARVSELLGLHPEDCGWSQRLVRLLGKGARVRFVPMGKPAMEALYAYTSRARPILEQRRKKGAATSQLFLNARGTPLSRMGVWKILRKRAREAGLSGRIHPHLLRHTYATHMLRGGASLRVVQELLGHARLATTQIYTSVDEPYLQAVHRQYHPRG